MEPPRASVGFLAGDRVRVSSGSRVVDVPGPVFREAVLDAVRTGADIATIVGALPGEHPAADAGPTILLPQPLDDYAVLRPVGEGAYGLVFEASDPASGERVALKVLRERNPWALESFKNEARFLVDCDHPSLVAPDEILEFDGRVALVMRYVEGVDFRTALATAAGAEGPLRDPPRCHDLLLGLLRAVHALHDLGRLHLDLKPDNVPVTADGTVLLLDFGVSRARRPTVEPLPANLGGTPFYAAPEQVLGQEVGPATDVYAVGVMVYEALTGVSPFKGVDVDETFARILHDPLPLGARRPGVPEPWSALVGAMLARAPDARPSTAALAARLGADGRDRPTAGDRFVGRERETAGLEACWAAALQGDGNLALVTGEPGAGKTRLAERFAVQVQSEGATVVWGRCSGRESIPYAAVDRVVDQLCALARSDVAVRAAVQAHPWFDDLCRVFPVFASLRPLGSSAGDPGPADRSRALGALRVVADHLAMDRPLLVVIDDAQWGDADSVDVVVALLSGTERNRLLVLLTARDAEWERSPLGTALESRLRKGVPYAVTRIEVGALPPLALAQLTADRLGTDLAASEVAEVVQACRGNLFELDRLLRQGVGSGGLAGALEAQLDDLPAESRALVRCAAVAGAPTELAVLVKAAGVPFPDRGALARLRARGLLRGAVGPSGRVFVCYHDLVREAVLERIDPETARAAHRGLARALAERRGDTGAIARHLYEAGERAEAAIWALRGASEAEAALAFARAAELLGLALDAGVAPLADERAVRGRYADALAEAGMGTLAATQFERLADDAPTSREALDHRRRAADALLTVGEIDRGLEILRPVVAELGTPLPGASLLGALLGLAGGVLTSVVRPRPAPDREADRAITAWTLVKGLIFVQPQIGALFGLRAAWHGWRSGRSVHYVGPTGLIAMGLAPLPVLYRLTDRWLRWSANAAATGADPRLLATHELWAALIALQDGALERAARRGARADELWAGIPGGAWERVQAAAIPPRAFLHMGDYAAAATASAVQLRDAERRNDVFAQVQHSLYLVLPAILRGAEAEPRQRCEWVTRTWMPGQVTAQSFLVMMNLCYLDLYLGRPRAAAARLVSFKPHFRRSGGHRFPIARVEHATVEGRIAVALGSAAFPGLLPVRRVIRDLRRDRNGPSLAHAALFQAALDLADAPAAATTSLARARASLEQAGVHMEAAAARLRLAELTGDDVEAAAARAAMRRLGAADPDRWAGVLLPPAPTRVAS